MSEIVAGKSRLKVMVSSPASELARAMASRKEQSTPELQLVFLSSVRVTVIVAALAFVTDKSVKKNVRVNKPIEAVNLEKLYMTD